MHLWPVHHNPAPEMRLHCTAPPNLTILRDSLTDGRLYYIFVEANVLSFTSDLSFLHSGYYWLSRSPILSISLYRSWYGRIAPEIANQRKHTQYSPHSQTNNVVGLKSSNSWKWNCMTLRNIFILLLWSLLFIPKDYTLMSTDECSPIYLSMYIFIKITLIALMAVDENLWPQPQMHSVPIVAWRTDNDNCAKVKTTAITGFWWDMAAADATTTNDTHKKQRRNYVTTKLNIWSLLPDIIMTPRRLSKKLSANNRHDNRTEMIWHCEWTTNWTIRQRRR